MMRKKRKKFVCIQTEGHCIGLFSFHLMSSFHFFKENNEDKPKRKWPSQGNFNYSTFEVVCSLSDKNGFS